MLTLSNNGDQFVIFAEVDGTFNPPSFTITFDYFISYVLVNSASVPSSGLAQNVYGTGTINVVNNLGSVSIPVIQLTQSNTQAIVQQISINVDNATQATYITLFEWQLLSAGNSTTILYSVQPNLFVLGNITYENGKGWTAYDLTGYPVTKPPVIELTGPVTGIADPTGMLATTITPTGVAAGTYAAVAVETSGQVIEGYNLTGDATSSLNLLTLNTVNNNVGTFGSATDSVTLTVNGKGLVTAASNVPIFITPSQINGQIDLTSQVTGILPVANGGLGTNSLPIFFQDLTNPPLPIPNVYSSWPYTLKWSGSEIVWDFTIPLDSNVVAGTNTGCLLVSSGYGEPIEVSNVVFSPLTANSKNTQASSQLVNTLNMGVQTQGTSGGNLINTTLVGNLSVLSLNPDGSGGGGVLASNQLTVSNIYGDGGVNNGDLTISATQNPTTNAPGNLVLMPGANASQVPTEYGAVTVGPYLTIASTGGQAIISMGAATTPSVAHIIQGTTKTSTSSADGDDIFIFSGQTQASGYTDGNIEISSNRGNVAIQGNEITLSSSNIIFSNPSGSSNVIAVGPDASLGVGPTSGLNYGTSGQVLTSAGSGAPVYWQTLPQPTSDTAIFNFSYGDATPYLLMQIPANKYIFSVEIQITTPFNGGAPALSIGDALNTDNYANLMATTDNDPTTIGSYQETNNVSYSSATDIYLAITPGSGTTAGAGIVIITYQN
jgi:hypothetical protein